MSDQVTRGDLIVRNLLDTAFWCAVLTPAFALVTTVSLLMLAWGGLLLIPFVVGPAYVMIVAGISQRTVPGTGWGWWLVLCAVGFASGIVGLISFALFEGLLPSDWEIWLWGALAAGGVWVGPALLNLSLLAGYSDEQCEILTRRGTNPASGFRSGIRRGGASRI